MGVFGTGSFSRGTLHRSTWTKLYAEFGFLHEQRRHRLVLLWDGAGQLDRIVLIREFLAEVQPWNVHPGARSADR